MEEVKFVRSLNVESRPLTKDMQVAYREFGPLNMAPVNSGEGFMYAQDDDVRAKIVPVCQISEAFKNTRDPSKNPHIENTYIAYSEEVEELLALPIKALNNQVVDAEARARKYQVMSVSLNEQVAELEKQVTSLKKNLDDSQSHIDTTWEAIRRIESQTIWQRIKAVFTKYRV